MTASTRILVVADTTTVDDVVALAEAGRWTLTDDVTRAHLVLASRRWSTSEGLDVTWVEDHTGDVRLVQLRGDGLEDLEVAVRGALTIVEPGALLVAAEGEPSEVELIRILSHLSVCRPPRAEPRWLAVWERGLAHDHPAVRRAAIRTAYGCPWPEMLELVRTREPLESRLADPLAQLRRHLEQPEG